MLSRNDKLLISGLLDPIMFFNIFMPEMDANIQEVRSYQGDMLRNRGRIVVAKTGRAVGKSRTLTSDVAQNVIMTPRKVGLITTPSMSHLQPIFDKLIWFFNSNKFFKNFLIRAIRTPAYQIDLANGFTLYGRIGGVGTTQGTSVLGLHADMLWADEAQLYSGMALEQLQGCINPGCRIRVYGVPNGMKDSFLAKLWDDDKVPSHCKYKITRFQDPSFTEDENKRLIRIFGGADNPSYCNQVLAEDTILQFRTFNPQHYSYCFLEKREYQNIRLRNEKDTEGFDFSNLDDIQLEDKTELSVSGDIGYDPDPSIIGLWSTDQNGFKQLLIKFKLIQVRPSKQVEFIDNLAKFFRVKRVSIDAGNIGKSVILDIDKIANRTYSVVPINFGGKIPLGTTSDGSIIKQGIKYYSTTLVNSAFRDKKISLPSSDLELFGEVEGSSRYQTKNGEWSYTGIDHHLDMIRSEVVSSLLPQSVKQSSEGTYVDFVDL